MTTAARARPDKSAQYLSLPVPVELREDDGDGCARLKLSDGWAKVVAMKNLWEIDGYQGTGGPVLRMHFRVTTEDGRGILLYQDLLEGKWYRQFSLGNDSGNQSTPIYRA